MKPVKIMIPEGEDLDKRSILTEKMLRLSGVEYTRIRTKSKVIIRPSDSAYQEKQYILKTLTPDELRFIGRVKKHFQTLPKPKRLGSVVKYNGSGKGIIPGVHTNYTEIDVNAAYWETAHKLGYIDDDLKKEAESYSKRARLVSLGALAKRTEYITYSPPDFNITDIRIETSELRQFWDNITWYFGTEMDRISEKFGSDVMGYWVDAIFCRNEAAAEIRQAFNMAGYPVKIVPLDRLEVREVDSGVFDILRYIGGKPKPLPPFDTNEGRVSTIKGAREKLLDSFQAYLNNR